jgi:hypothetical protein
MTKRKQCWLSWHTIDNETAKQKPALALSGQPALSMATPELHALSTIKGLCFSHESLIPVCNSIASLSQRGCDLAPAQQTDSLRATETTLHPWNAVWAAAGRRPVIASAPSI